MTLTDGEGNTVFTKEADVEIKTESGAVRELQGKPPITISTEIDPDFVEEEETSGSESANQSTKVDENSD